MGPMADEVRKPFRRIPMSGLRKIDETNNVLTWFEIPVSNTQRAKSFYEQILDIEMTTQQFPETNEELTFFPHDPNDNLALSGRLTGALCRRPDRKPVAEGVRIYINASPSVEAAVDRVAAAGGKVLMPATSMPFGVIAEIVDSEGNCIGLHADK